MKLTFYGGAKMVTGANYLLTVNSQKILIDCGLHQGSNYCERLNFEPFSYNPKEISAVFITHAHIDHIGLLPKLYRHGFRGKIFSTSPTREFAELLLLDSEDILRREAEREGKKPLYTGDDIRAMMSIWEGVEYHQSITVGDCVVTFSDAGHILGSAFILVEVGGKKVVFSGDLGNYPAPIIKKTEFPPEVDYCLIESTYGNRIHEDENRRKEIIEDTIEDTIKMGGVLMIPAFAMERTQELLYELNDLVENGRIPTIPIFIDSPLAIKLTDVYRKYQRFFNDQTTESIRGGDAIFNFPGLTMSLTTEESKAINDVRSTKVIIAGSGMSQGGRILHHERRYLSDPKSAILFVGYQAVGSLGRRILDGASAVTIFGEEIPVRCRVRALGGYSAHADQPRLLEWISKTRQSLKKVFVVQGEVEASLILAQKIKDELAVDAIVPSLNDSVEL